jgi:SAM-dependent methyltransferase
MTESREGPGEHPGESEIGLVEELWTPEAIARFWQFYSQHADQKGLYSSDLLGTGLSRFLLAAGVLAPGRRVLDFGCGPGYLLQHMLSAGATCWGVDLSTSAVTVTNQRLHGQSGWQGAVVHDDANQLAAGSFDLVTCIETLEHLQDNDLDRLLNEIHGLLARSGAAFFTTPNEENLAAAAILCPFCSTVFHPMQHLRAFSSVSLREVLADHGFDVVLCTATNLGWFQLELPASPFEWTLAHFGGRLRRRLWRLLDRMTGRPFAESREYRQWLGNGPHLVALATPKSANTTGYKPDRR